jgi:Pentapeptide repeats (8 copies)
VNFRAAHLTETSFARALLRGATLDNAEGDGIEFRGADLQGASLTGAHFDEADFRGADLRSADLTQGHFHGADFRGALLDGAKFDGADVSGALFDPAAGPIPSVQSEAHAAENPDAAVRLLSDLLAALPDAISGAEPDQMMNRVQDLVGRLAESSGYSTDQQRQIRDYLTRLTKPGEFDAEQFQRMVAALDSSSNEPPEEFRVWLEPLMRVMKDRNV